LIAESSFHFFTLLPDGPLRVRQPGRRMCPSAGSIKVERTSGQLLRPTRALLRDADEHARANVLGENFRRLLEE